jgi:hypothetical protein
MSNGLFIFAITKALQMNNGLNYSEKYCPRASDTRKRSVTLPILVFLCPGVSSYIGFLHSFSRPDFIEVIQSGGQQTDCLLNIHAMIQLSTWDLQNREIKQMLKTVMRG